MAPVKKGLASDGTKTQKLPAFPAARLRETNLDQQIESHFNLARLAHRQRRKKRNVPCRPSFPWTG